MIRVTAQFKEDDGELFEPLVEKFAGYLKNVEREGDLISFIARGNDANSTYEEFENFVRSRHYPIAWHKVEQL